MRKVIRAERRKSARLLMVAAATAAGTLASHNRAEAAVRTWINTTNGQVSWSTTSNWSSTGTPSSTDSGVISLTDANIHTILIDANVPASGGLLGLTADDTGTGTLEILLNVAGRTFTIGNAAGSGGVETLGVSGKMLFEQDNGTHTNTGTSGSFTLGLNATANATYNLTNGLLNIASANPAVIGSSGTGTFTQSGGTASFSGGITLGSVSTGSGLYNLNTGNFTTTNLAIGGGGKGTFTQVGGTATVGSLDISSLSQGSYTLGAGTGSLTVTGASTIGDLVDGTFTQSGGTSAFTGDVGVGNSVTVVNFTPVPVKGSVNVSGGTFTAGNLLLGKNGGNGFFTQQTTGIVNITKTLTLGNDFGSTGTYTLTSGTATIANATPGQGIGFFIQNGGTASFSGILTVGPGNNSSAPGSVNGPGYALTNGILAVAQGIVGGTVQSGSFAQSGGNATFTTSLIIGQTPNASSLYDLQTGSLTTTNMTLGAGGIGQFSQENGTALINGTNPTDSLLLGSVSSGTGSYTMSGGSLTVTAPGGVVVGSVGQQVVFAHSAGTVNVGTVANNRNITIGTVGVVGGTPAGAGIYALSGTGLLNVNGSIFVGGTSTTAGGTGTLSVTGGTGTVTGSIKVWNTAGSSFAMSGGTLTVPTIDTSSNGNFFTFTGGILNLTGAGGFTVGSTGQTTNLTLSPGQFLNNTAATTVQSTGKLTFSGGALSTTSLTSSPGTVMFNSGTLTLTASGLTIDTNGAVGNTLAIPTNSSVTASGVITNNGTLQLAGGSIGGAAMLNNTGFMSGFGVITGAGGFNNLGFMQVTGGNLSLAKTGTLINSNGGTITFDPGFQLQLASGSNLTNDGEIDLNGGFINTTAGASLVNNADGSITGNGTISTALTNNGAIDVPTGTLTTAAFTNNGSISLDSSTSRLTASGAGLTNAAAGYVIAQGRINGPVVNSGTLEVSGGLLTLPGNVTNNATGNVTIDSGATAFITGTLAANAGTINNNGGTLNTNGQAITNNAGAIVSGHGAFRTGTITNNGQIVMTGGASDVYGGINTSSGAKVILSGNATGNFYGAINVVSGGEFRVSTGSTAEFFAPVTGLSFFTGGGTKDFQAGASNVGALNTEAATVVENGASLATTVIRENSLSVAGNVTVAANGTSGATTDVNSLTMLSTGQLDLSNNDMIVRNGAIGAWNGTAYTGILGSLATGRNGGAWNGNGIVTSQSNAKSPTMLTTLAAATAGSIGKTGATFGGQTVNANDVLVMYTYAGDANLDGKINADDYFEIDHDYGHTDSGSISYLGGDFNYDGKVNGDDYFLIDANFDNQTTPFNFANAPDIDGSPALTLSGTSAVPEPTMLGLIPLVGMALARRRRRQA